MMPVPVHGAFHAAEIRSSNVVFRSLWYATVDEKGVGEAPGPWSQPLMVSGGPVWLSAHGLYAGVV